MQPSEGLRPDQRLLLVLAQTYCKLYFEAEENEAAVTAASQALTAIRGLDVKDRSHLLAQRGLETLHLKDIQGALKDVIEAGSLVQSSCELLCCLASVHSLLGDIATATAHCD